MSRARQLRRRVPIDVRPLDDEARAVGASEIAWVARQRGGEIFRYVATLKDEGNGSTRVVLEVAPGVRITSVITTASATRLGLREGKRAVAIIKATEVILAGS